ncbi:uncharacterized protein LOC127899080 [Citrus sinensis]|uniref:uncharacterized protein LOC127899080 n=1 Tax=Citrus sinensis TaxID=2711 RepID=UPI002279D753|nr:uncharacterized protein LOC127899080 [Citrus sinensis]
MTISLNLRNSAKVPSDESKLLIQRSVITVVIIIIIITHKNVIGLPSFCIGKNLPSFINKQICSLSSDRRTFIRTKQLCQALITLPDFVLSGFMIFDTQNQIPAFGLHCDFVHHASASIFMSFGNRASAATGLHNGGGIVELKNRARNRECNVTSLGK